MIDTKYRFICWNHVIINNITFAILLSCYCLQQPKENNPRQETNSVTAIILSDNAVNVLTLTAPPSEPAPVA